MEGTPKKHTTYREIIDGCHRIAEKIKRENPNASDRELVAVARGGLIPALIVAHILDAKLEDIKIFKATSYDDGTKKQGKITLTPVDDIKNSPNTYFIEDILDSGITVSHIKRMYPNTRVAALVSKQEDNKDLWFAGTVVPKGEWVVFPGEEEKNKSVDGCEGIRRQCAQISNEIKKKSGADLSRVQLVAPIGSSLVDLAHVANYVPTKNVGFVRLNGKTLSTVEDSPHTYCVCNSREADLMRKKYPNSNVAVVDNVLFASFLMQKVKDYTKSAGKENYI
jgi:xanthine phosphoribosyltransferase